MSTSPSIARSFTKRHRRPQISAPLPHRDGQVKYAAGTIRRDQISSPVELICTTNTLVFTAPDLPSASVASANSSSSSLKSSTDSDVGQSTSGSSTPFTSPDISPIANSPVPPEPNHLSSYFESRKRSNTSTSNSRSSTSTTSSTTSIPVLPQRSLSHTKKSHQDLALQRSRSRTTPPPTSHTNTHAARLSQERLHKHSDSTPHPFGKELEQVNEVAEEFGGMHLVWAEDEQIMRRNGLMKFAAEDYISEIEGLWKGFIDVGGWI